MAAKKQAGKISQSQRKKPVHPNSIANLKKFEPGQSGNPGGMPVGTPRVKVAFIKLLQLTTAEFEAFKPSNVAEDMAYRQLKRALGEQVKGGAEAIGATEKIIDRLEGRPAQSIDITSDGKQLKGYVGINPEEDV
jgi:hypothetical protein